jgi:hypothetical protein
MTRRLLTLAGLLVLLAPLAGAETSIGYSYLKSLEDGGGSVPLGGYLSFAGGTDVLSPELDLAYHRDSDFDIDTFTAFAGPRFGSSSGGFLRVMGGLRYARFEGDSDTAWGGMGGVGFNLKTSGRMSVRLGADFQMFFKDGEKLKVLRLNAGLGF